MILNFGHTFAHAIEVKNNYSKNITHGEAVLWDDFSYKTFSNKKVCNKKTLEDLVKIYNIKQFKLYF